MAYTTPRTYVAAEIHTASHHNVYERDNIAWLATDSPACRVYSSVAFSHNSSGNWMAVTFNSERYDNAAMHDTGSNTDRITIPSGGAGKYLFGGNMEWQSGSATGTRITGISANGTPGTTYGQASDSNLNSAANYDHSIVVTASCAVADIFRLIGWQDSGGTRTIVSASAYSPEFWAFWFRI